MKITFGKPINSEDDSSAVVWDSTQVMNGHIILVGASGTGKTTRLRRFMSATIAFGARMPFDIIDPHGDMEIDGEDIAKFGETSPIGLNPLQVSDDPDRGGVRKRIRTFVEIINRTSRPLGPKQENVLTNLLVDLYAAHGFELSDADTWRLDIDRRQSRRGRKRYPTVTDLKQFTENKLMQMMTGTNGAAIAALEALNRHVKALARGLKRANGGDFEVDISKLKENCRELYGEYLDAIVTGEENIDVLKYYSREVLQSVYERICNLASTGLFKPNAPVLSRTVGARRYDISTLNSDEQKILVDILSESVFDRCRSDGLRAEPSNFLVLDEAHKFVTDDSDHILNVIQKEARKFGLGLILASQSLSHFPEDIIANAGTKLILGIDEMFHDTTARKLGIHPRRLASIKPRKTALLQIKTASSLSQFIDIALH